MKLLDISTPKHPNTFCKVDDEDFDFLNQWKWGPSCHGRNIYAVRTSRKSRTGRINMHRLVFNATPTQIIDHIDGDGLNNQKQNLRFCSRQQNNCNARKRKSNTTSIYKGVMFERDRNKWRAVITSCGRIIRIGRFSREHEAAIAYNNAALIHFGEYALLNKIQC